MRSRSLPFFVTAVVVELVFAGFARIGLGAEAPPGFVAVPQFGPEYTEAIEIAPNRSWFLSGTYGAIDVWDLKSGAILRELTPDRAGRFTRMAISADGRLVFARLAADVGDDTDTAAWSAETGLPIENAETLAPPLDSSAWVWIDHKWPSSRSLPKEVPFDVERAKKYLVDQQIAFLVDLEKVASIEATDRQDVVQVTTSGEVRDDAEETLWSYHVYFIDVVRRTLVADVSGKTLRTFCGRPHGAFAFDGRHLLLAATEPSEVSSSNISALMVDTRPVPPVLEWSRPCQNHRVSSMWFERGLVVVAATPDQVAVWDPATARRIIHIGDIHDSDVLTWSTDLTTFATGFHERRTVAEPHRFGVAVVRSGKELFFPIDAEVSEVRLGADGSKIFARTKDGWSAWDASSGARLSSFAVPVAANEASATRRSRRKSSDGKLEIVKDQLIETATGRVLVQGQFLQFSEDSRFVWNTGPIPIQSIRVWEAASGRLLWRAIANDGENPDFLVMQHADGRAFVSEGAEGLVKFVRGFEVRPLLRQPR
jgi:hypothetical protein